MKKYVILEIVDTLLSTITRITAPSKRLMMPLTFGKYYGIVKVPWERRASTREPKDPGTGYNPRTGHLKGGSVCYRWRNQYVCWGWSFRL